MKNKFPCPFEDCSKHLEKNAPVTQEGLNRHLGQAHRNKAIQSQNKTINMNQKEKMEYMVTTMLRESSLPMSKAELVTKLRKHFRQKANSLKTALGRIVRDPKNLIQRIGRGHYQMSTSASPKIQSFDIEPEVEENIDSIRIERDILRSNNQALKEIALRLITNM